MSFPIPPSTLSGMDALSWTGFATANEESLPNYCIFAALWGYSSYYSLLGGIFYLLSQLWLFGRGHFRLWLDLKLGTVILDALYKQLPPDWAQCRYPLTHEIHVWLCISTFKLAATKSRFWRLAESAFSGACVIHSAWGSVAANSIRNITNVFFYTA